jgi:Fur family transcriptional regulator, ferric uptake regulator
VSGRTVTAVRPVVKAGRGAPGGAAEATRGATRDALRGAGLRVTPQRVAVLETLSDAGGHHLSADDVWQRLSSAGSSMDRSTAYRVLADLADAGLLTQVRLEDSVARFEVQGVAHHHAVCVVCGSTQDVPVDALRPLSATLARRTGFRVSLREPLMVRGTCRDCTARGISRAR